MPADAPDTFLICNLYRAEARRIPSCLSSQSISNNPIPVSVRYAAPITIFLSQDSFDDFNLDATSSFNKSPFQAANSRRNAFDIFDV